MSRPLPSSRGYKIIKKLSNFCIKYKFLHPIVKLVWKHMIWCNHCGKDIGFNSVISRFGFNCWDCHDVKVLKENK